MACFETGTIVRLGAREAITLPDIGGATLRVTRGTLWITQDRTARDTVLRTGDSWAVERDGATVVEAQERATFAIVAPRPARPIRVPARPGVGSRLVRGVAAWLSPPPGHRAPYF